VAANTGQSLLLLIPAGDSRNSIAVQESKRDTTTELYYNTLQESKRDASKDSVGDLREIFALIQPSLRNTHRRRQKDGVCSTHVYYLPREEIKAWWCIALVI